MKNFWDDVDVLGADECWLWTRSITGKGGYGCAWVNGKRHRAHRLAFQLAQGEIPNGMFVCHRCDTPLCCNPRHLFLGTNAQNMQDCAKKGRNGQHVHPEKTARGEQNGISKLTAAQVTEIRRLVSESSDRLITAKLARQFRVSSSQIRRIVTREHWNHV